MKKSSILFLVSLLIFVLQTGAQIDKTGVVVENRESELLQSDPLNGKQHYKPIPFTLKKGEAVLFTMKSSAFIPHILFGTNQAIIVMGQINESGTESKATFLAPADTAFFIFFTSMEENKTGKFSYGYNLLGAAQIKSINNQFTPGNLGKQLIELLDHAKDGFKAIRSGKVNTEKESQTVMDLDGTTKQVTFIINHFTSIYLLENAKETRIKERFPEGNQDNSNTEFNATYGSGMSKTQGEDLYDKLVTHIKQELPGYVMKEFKDDYGSGGYSKFLLIKRDNNYQKYTITIDFLFVAGVGIISSDNATVKITVK